MAELKSLTFPASFELDGIKYVVSKVKSNKPGYVLCRILYSTQQFYILETKIVKLK